MQAQLKAFGREVLGEQGLVRLWLLGICKESVNLLDCIRSFPPLHHTTYICASSPSYISISFHDTFSFHLASHDSYKWGHSTLVFGYLGLVID